MRGSHILPSHTDAILTVTARSQKRPINVQGISGKPQEVRQGNGEKKLCSPDDNKNAGAKTGQKHKNDRALCRVKYGENIQWCSRDGCIQDRVTIFIGPYFFPSLQLNYYEHRHGLILDSSCDYVSARVVSFELEKGANQVLSPANWIRTWFTDLIFDGLRRTKTHCARSDYDLC